LSIVDALVSGCCSVLCFNWARTG